MEVVDKKKIGIGEVHRFCLSIGLGYVCVYFSCPGTLVGMVFLAFEMTLFRVSPNPHSVSLTGPNPPPCFRAVPLTLSFFLSLGLPLIPEPMLLWLRGWPHLYVTRSSVNLTGFERAQEPTKILSCIGWLYDKTLWLSMLALSFSFLLFLSVHRTIYIRVRTHIC